MGWLREGHKSYGGLVLYLASRYMLNKWGNGGSYKRNLVWDLTLLTVRMI